MFSQSLVSFTKSPGLLSLVGACICVDAADFTGIHIAGRNLAEDFARVTKGLKNPIRYRTDDCGLPDDKALIIIGSISSPLLQRLERDGQLDLNALRGKWEAHMTSVIEVGEGRKALVIAGSDKRGTIFGTYTLSEQIGVSPWYWWADVPTKYHPEIYAFDMVTMQAEPSVKFRGIFINDEAPALTGWVLEKFGGYNAEFYEKVFELLLRLKANFLWPAMWPGYPNPGASFFTDDALNQQRAEDYGICISTSHHEPMQRQSNEWFATNADGTWDWLTNKQSITDFFREGVSRAKGHESYFTLGMRGEYDKKMKTDDPAAVVRDVIKTQRRVIAEVEGKADAVPQLLALYKEVQEQYETDRLEVPDDVTLLFADDNFGTLRRLPRPSERGRKGGAGIYYHFEYVGDPRSYKWINSNSLGRTWHQLQQAYHHDAKQIWVFNVGDIKPLEVPLTFAMALAWDIDSIKAGTLPQFFTTMAEREYGPGMSQEIGEIWKEHDRLCSIRRHEHIGPETFSLLHFNEAEIILERWKDLLARAEAVHDSVAEEQRPSIFQLVLHPVKASYIFIALQITLGRNQLYARQRRNSANLLAQRVLDLFDADFTLSEEFHALADSKWNHIMQQPHYGFGDTWHAPSRDMISGLCYIQRRQNSNAVVGQMGVAVEGHKGVRPGRCNEESDRTHPSRRDLVPGVTLGAMTRYGPLKKWFDIFTRGAVTVHWIATAPYDWISLTSTGGELVPGMDDVRVEVDIDWEKVPRDFYEKVLIDIRSAEGDFERVHLPIHGREAPQEFAGLVEGDGYVCMLASSATIDPSTRVLPDTGRETIGSVSMVDGSSMSWLTYRFYTFTEASSVDLQFYFSMTLDLDPTSPMQYEILFDKEPVQAYTLYPESIKSGELPSGWMSAVQDCVWIKKHNIPKKFESGVHEVSIKLMSSNLILEKVVVDLGGVKESYLGPPSSYKTHE